MTRSTGRPVRLVVVDDSSFIRLAVARMMVDVKTIEVVGAASSGEELLSRWDEWNPDVVTLDLSMPGMGGLMTLDQIVARGGPPVIILSTHSGLGAPQTIEALRRGAADFIDKQEYSLLDFSAVGKVLEERVLAVSRGDDREAMEEREVVRRSSAPAQDFEVLVIGASTGGPPAIEQVLVDLGKWCPVPVLVVQHMPEGFVTAFADRLNSRLPLGVFEAQEGARLAPRTVHIGPAGKHLQIVRRDGGLEASLTLRPRDALHRPSVDVLFQSACDVT
ncbi:MAG: response regulator, partial [Thermoanaerobaculia bacterium]|nr:response regulator [Thermoanaerobaculia bacterium]